MEDNPVIGCFMIVLLILFFLFAAEKACNDFLGVKQPSTTETRIPTRTETYTPHDQETYTPPVQKPSPKTAQNTSAFVMTENNNGLYLQSEKNLNSSTIVFAPEGSEVTILYYDQNQVKIRGKVGRWCRVRYDGREGWAWGWDLEIR